MALLREQLPAETERIIHEAGELLGHRFDLLGYSGLDYGRTIDWHLDAISGKRVPLRPWFKIDFLNFEKVGDHKVIWELNRHQHLVTLAKAYCVSGDKRYVTELVAQWRSWQKANPYPLGINWASSLEVAFRSLSWLWVLHLLGDGEVLPSGFAADVRRGLMLHGRHVERYLSTYFSPNTHLLGEALALFALGTSCPEFAAAERWKKEGWEILLKEMERQVRSDGVYFEQSLYYHVYALDFFLHARILAERNAIAIPPQFDETVNKMLNVVQALSQAGPPEAFGDDDGGRLFNPRRNRTENLTDPLAIGAILYGREDLASGAKLTEESVWLFGEQAMKPLSGQHVRSSMQSRAFTASGIYVMADAGLKAELVVDAGPQGTGRCGHGHADALAVTLSANGRRWLVDSGSYRYVSCADERDALRGTAAHNTLRVDHLDQAVSEGPFAWNSIPKVTAETWVRGNSFEFLAGNHDGYQRLSDPVIHRRYVFHLHGGFWMIRDVAEGRGCHDLEIFWHFAPDLDVTENECGFVARPRITEQPSGNPDQLALLFCGDPAWTEERASAFESPAYGKKCTAVVARLSTSANLPAEYATLLLPSQEKTAIGEFGALSDTISGLHGYRYQTSRVVHEFFFSDDGKAWDSCGWASDAKFLYCCREDGHPVHLVMVDGSFASWQEQRVITHRLAIQHFEWTNRRGRLETSSSDSSAVEYLYQGELAGVVSEAGELRVK